MDVLTLLFALGTGFSLGMLFVQIFTVHRLEREIIQMKKQGFISYPDLPDIPHEEYKFVRED